MRSCPDTDIDPVYFTSIILLTNYNDITQTGKLRKIIQPTTTVLKTLL